MSKTIKLIGLTEQLAQNLLMYLSQQPYGQVKGLVDAIQKSPIVDATINEQPAADGTPPAGESGQPSA